MNKILFFDGAFGTYYHERYGNDEKCEMANIHAPERVEKIHLEYIASGARAIRTNSFGVNSALFGDALLRRELIEKSYEIAVNAANEADGVEVFADIGYVYSPTSDTAADYLESAGIFIECGAKNFLFETLAELDPVLPAVRLIREKAKDSVIMISFAVSADGYTSTGLYYRNLIEQARDCGADITGLNCICGPSDMLALVKKLPVKEMNLSVLPNSNYPAQTGFGLRYSNNAEYFAGKILEMYNLGAYAVGGCCGTTPEHIRKVTSSINGESRAYITNPVGEAGQIQPVPKLSRLQRALNKGKTVIAVELDPPENTDIGFLIDSAESLKRAGADVITLADSPLARPRADSFITAARVSRDVGIETLPHLACRDKNRIAIHSQLLGAGAENVQNVLVITGDSISKSNPTDIGGDKNVFNFNSLTLISYIDSLNESVFASAPFCIAAALNVNAANFEAELKRAKQKEERGATVFLTQAIFTDDSIKSLQRARESLKGKILAGILPIAGYRNALFLNNEVSGMSIPHELVESLKDKSPEETKQISLAFCRSIIDRAREFCDGYYLMTPRKKVDFVTELVHYINSVSKSK